MAELTRQAAAVPRGALLQSRTADASADRDHQDQPLVASRVHSALRDQRHGGVVLDPTGQGRIAGQQAPEIEAGDVEVAGGPDLARAPVDPTGDPDADRRVAIGAQLIHEAQQLCREAPPILPHRLDDAVDQLSRAADPRDADARTADVDANGRFSHAPHASRELAGSRADARWRSARADPPEPPGRARCSPSTARAPRSRPTPRFPSRS